MKKEYRIWGMILIFVIIVIISHCYLQNRKINQNEIDNIIEVNLTNENNVDVEISKSTTEIPILTEEDEQTVEVQETE